MHVKLGQRQIGEEEKEEIHRIISQKGNLLVRSIESDVREEQPGLDFAKIELVKGMVRSGQTIQHDGNILFFMGDVNPGGTILSTGSIYVMGSLKGMAHAGRDGDESAVIAASLLNRPS